LSEIVDGPFELAFEDQQEALVDEVVDLQFLSLAVVLQQPIQEVGFLGGRLLNLLLSLDGLLDQLELLNGLTLLADL
jgi:hypothetical protein